MNRWEGNDSRVCEEGDIRRGIRTGVGDIWLGSIRVSSADVGEDSRDEDFLVETVSCDANGVIFRWFVELHHY